MFKILIADDEADIRAVIREYAEFEGYTAIEASDGMDAVRLCRENDFDVVIMDAMMPKLDGFSASKEIKKLGDTPILMLSARGEEYDKLFGFEVGADDYVVKPFSPKELMARVNVIVSRRRRAAAAAPGAELTLGALAIDVPGRTVRAAGQKLDLTPKEYELLLYFAQNAGVALTRDALLNAVWGVDDCGDDRTVDAQVKLLRAKLGQCRDYIVTLRGVGYKFEPQ
ncbi:MAG: response regulator transcription factor [Oscillospiraceae bacterium]|jgi:DNA-binding response OmpR family regulator|nr:response regulator transcription factor [Oscillospiraceae bacterium]